MPVLKTLGKMCLNQKRDSDLVTINNTYMITGVGRYTHTSRFYFIIFPLYIYMYIEYADGTAKNRIEPTCKL